MVAAARSQDRIAQNPAYMARPLFFNLHGCGQDCGEAAEPPYPRVGEVRIQPVPVKFTSIVPVPQVWNKVPQVLRVNSPSSTSSAKRSRDWLFVSLRTV